MSWIYIIPAILLTDITLYLKYWKRFAQRFYFMNYGIGVGWLMASKLMRKQ